MSNIDWNELDKKIVPLVRFLNKKGIVTKQSCSGHRGNRSFYYKNQPWVSITKESFYKFRKSIISALYYKPYWSNGDMHIVDHGPLFCNSYDIRFWNLDCVNDFIRRFK